jgi:hypothetical protein
VKGFFGTSKDEKGLLVEPEFDEQAARKNPALANKITRYIAADPTPFGR